jgi:hypothetical protein
MSADGWKRMFPALGRTAEKNPRKVNERRKQNQKADFAPSKSHPEYLRRIAVTASVK